MQANAKTVGAIVLTVILTVLVVMLAIGWLQSDPTNHRGDQRPPDHTPASTFPTSTPS